MRGPPRRVMGWGPPQASQAAKVLRASEQGTRVLERSHWDAWRLWWQIFRHRDMSKRGLTELESGGQQGRLSPQPLLRCRPDRESRTLQAATTFLARKPSFLLPGW